MRLLETKGFTVSPERREQVLSCTDPAQIEASWVDRLVAAQRLEDVLG